MLLLLCVLHADLLLLCVKTWRQQAAVSTLGSVSVISCGGLLFPPVMSVNHFQGMNSLKLNLTPNLLHCLNVKKWRFDRFYKYTFQKVNENHTYDITK